MTAAAQIGEGAVAVQGDARALGERVDELDLVGLPALEEVLDGLLPRDLALHEGIADLDDVGHDPFELAQILVGERVLGVEVVVEARVDRRADGELGLGPDALDRVGEHVRRGVPQLVDGFDRSLVVSHEEGLTQTGGPHEIKLARDLAQRENSSKTSPSCQRSAVPGA